jgi:predicted MPP superfamily phosphohydrolase
MHVGPWTNGRVLRAMVEKTNALRTDLVLLTGDLIHYDLADLPEAIALVKAMQGRYGLWMIEGNHDLFENAGEFERRVKAAGLHLLLDEWAVADVRGHPVQLFGLSWIGAGNAESPADTGDESQRDKWGVLQLHRLMKERHSEVFPILLAHHPHAFDAAAEFALPLTLAGHTHGGQWMLDSRHGAGPVLFRYWSGLYTRAGSQLIVSNGVGNVLPLRISAPAEIVHITLRCAS